MAVKINNNIMFYHIPRTGGSWFTNYVRVKCKSTNSLIGRRHGGDVHVKYNEYAKVSIIRHPMTWYPSMFCHSSDPVVAWKWTDNLLFLREYKSENFNEFLNKCKDSKQPLYERVVDAVLGNKWEHIQHFIYYEKLIPASVSLLKELRFDASLISAGEFAPIKKSFHKDIHSSNFKNSADNRLLKEVANKETRILKQFYS